MNKEEAKKLITSAVKSDIVIKHLSGDVTFLDATGALKKIFSALDQLEPNQPKVKLPLEVGEWVDECYDGGNAAALLDYEKTPDAVDEWCDGYNNDGINDHFGVLLMQAYLYGWTREPEKLYVLPVPGTTGNGKSRWYVHTGKPVGVSPNRMTAREAMTCPNNAYRWTKAQTEDYGFDGEAFMKVLAEGKENE